MSSPTVHPTTSSPTLLPTTGTPVANGSLPDPTRTWIALALIIAVWVAFLLNAGGLAWRVYYAQEEVVVVDKRRQKKKVVTDEYWIVTVVTHWSLFLVTLCFCVASLILGLIPEQIGGPAGNVADPGIPGNQASQVLLAVVILTPIVIILNFSIGVVWGGWLNAMCEWEKVEE